MILAAFVSFLIQCWLWSWSPMLFILQMLHIRLSGHEFLHTLTLIVLELVPDSDKAKQFMFKYTKIWPSRVSPMFSADDSHREEGTPKSWNRGKLPRKRYLNSGNKSWKRQHFLPHIPRITTHSESWKIRDRDFLPSNALWGKSQNEIVLDEMRGKSNNVKGSDAHPEIRYAVYRLSTGINPIFKCNRECNQGSCNNRLVENRKQEGNKGCGVRTRHNLLPIANMINEIVVMLYFTNSEHK